MKHVVITSGETVVVDRPSLHLRKKRNAIISRRFIGC